MNSANAKDEDVDLKERILMAAIEEFGKHGYKAASTNEIVKNAGVSKGLLFHYYHDKKNLFLECTLHVLDTVAGYVIVNLDTSDDDMFLRLKNSLKIKLDFYKKYPVFMGMASSTWYSDKRQDIESYMEKKYNVSYKRYDFSNFFINVDKSKLQKNMDFNTVIEFTSLLLEACWLRLCGKYNNDSAIIAEHTDEYLAEVDMALELIKHGAYEK